MPLTIRKPRQRDPQRPLLEGGRCRVEGGGGGPVLQHVRQLGVVLLADWRLQ